MHQAFVVDQNSVHPKLYKRDNLEAGWAFSMKQKDVRDDTWVKVAIFALEIASLEACECHTNFEIYFLPCIHCQSLILVGFPQAVHCCQNVFLTDRWEFCTENLLPWSFPHHRHCTLHHCIQDSFKSSILQVVHDHSWTWRNRLKESSYMSETSWELEIHGWGYLQKLNYTTYYGIS